MKRSQGFADRRKAHNHSTLKRGVPSCISIMLLTASFLAIGGFLLFSSNQTTPSHSLKSVHTAFASVTKFSLLHTQSHQTFLPEKTKEDAASSTDPSPLKTVHKDHQINLLRLDTTSTQQHGQESNLPAYNESKILERIAALKAEVATLRSSKTVLMPLHPRAVALTTALQNVTRCYLMHAYSAHLAPSSRSTVPRGTSRSSQVLRPLNLAIKLKFPPHMVTADAWLNEVTKGDGIITLYVELAPALLLPHAFFTITQIVHTFKSGHFHRNAGHVLQSNIAATYKGGVVFMEYHPLFPHEKYTLGFAGRGGGNAFYISTVNNTSAHGPGTERGGKDPESDTDFGIVIPGYNGEAIVHSMTKQTGMTSKNGFIDDKKNFILILSLRLLNGDELLAEIGPPGEVKKSKYSLRQEYLKRLQNSIQFASVDDYCGPFL